MSIEKRQLGARETITHVADHGGLNIKVSYTYDAEAQKRWEEWLKSFVQTPEGRKVFARMLRSEAAK